MKDHEPTIDQENAFNAVVKAMKKAEKLGLCFFGKQENLFAYTTSAVQYINENHYDCIASGFEIIPSLSKKLLFDSGADDTWGYRSKEDENKYTKT